MKRFITVKVKENSDADRLLRWETIWVMRNVLFDGTVVYSYPRLWESERVTK